MVFCDLPFSCKVIEHGRAKPNLQEQLGKYILVLNCVFCSTPAFGNLVHGEDLNCQEKVSWMEPLDMEQWGCYQLFEQARWLQLLGEAVYVSFVQI